MFDSDKDYSGKFFLVKARMEAENMSKDQLVEYVLQLLELDKNKTNFFKREIGNCMKDLLECRLKG